MSDVEVSVVLPAYNEEATIERTVEVTLETLASFLPAGAFEVIVAEDGCDDRTPEIATRLADEDDRVRHVHSDERLGRGGALEYAFERAAGTTLVYFDTDLATDMKHLEELVESVRSGESDVATGSRWMPENQADRPTKRAVSSLGYNTLVRLFLRSDMQDHQCGFKAISRETFDALRGEVEDEHWFWDTEVLVLAQRGGYSVREFPVDWEPKGDTKVDLVRDVFGMGSQILRTWWQLSVSPRISRRVSMAAGSLLVMLALVVAVGVVFDLQAVFDAMSGADPVLVVASGAVYLASWPLRGLRYRDILDRLGYPSDTWFMTGAVFISQTGNLVFPARLGDGVRAYVVKARRDVPYPSGFASLAVERVFDLLAITVLGGTVLVGLVATDGTEQIAEAIAAEIPPVQIGGETIDAGAAARTALRVAAAVGGAAVLGVLGILASARLGDDYVHRAVGAVSNDSYADYVAGVIEQFVGDVQAVVGDRGAFLRVGVGSLVIWVVDVATALVVFAAFPGITLTPALVATAFFAVSVGNLAKVLPLSPGGIGLYEGAFTLIVFGLTNVAAPVAFAISIVDHVVKNAVTILGGLASMAWLNVSLTTAVEESREASEVEAAAATED
ncbi:flippase-like domain-containing protein [Halosimplex litoreum]|uniref:Flippase-like domain-containing protein n=1 Tax=Halosimplex litoreum TaxID=1198301 RepID=A0A7T3G0D5_9EURY|nr:lysylphosphatidylglycerol synthase domain-containing protein [Halosimplex litoreum]QPV63962.1 flippase-like domain-containing protein [Halosimplex litoreum]